MSVWAVVVAVAVLRDARAREERAMTNTKQPEWPGDALKREIAAAETALAEARRRLRTAERQLDECEQEVQAAELRFDTLTAKI